MTWFRSAQSFLPLLQRTCKARRRPDNSFQTHTSVSIISPNGHLLGASGASRTYQPLPGRRGRPWETYLTTRNYTTTPKKDPKADEYIQELQDLYEIAKDELEIATESTEASTNYAASDRAALREAFDDLEHAYAAYTGGLASPSLVEGQRGNGVEGARSTRFDSDEIPLQIREEIKRRVGQRIRELRNAVQVLERAF
ncbi:hypothetical protein PRK78_007103 [Emydomyces testavorans]|uniref:Uncharacterized protein n=1 Tax=Emydomyces testavorans TaxID=2070801 RepID=A0AAF0DPM1_9EURO|nr:hypothetical protein PRK78_007103 [Emydomyces testavorans]